MGAILKLIFLLLALLSSLTSLLLYNGGANFYLQRENEFEVIFPATEFIDIDEELYSYGKLSGFMFINGTITEVVSPILTSFLHSFHDLSQIAVRQYVDPLKETTLNVLSPAFLWNESYFLCIFRLYYIRKKDSTNTFDNSFLYSVKYDRKLNRISPGEILGIPAANLDSPFEGPHDPRIFKIRNSTFILFYVKHRDESDELVDQMVFWNYESKTPIIPRIGQENAPETFIGKNSKNWMPLVQNDELYFVIMLDPLKVIHCRLDGYCKYVHYDSGYFDESKQGSFLHLRGGTPFVHYANNYYISLIHTTLFEKDTYMKYYHSHLLILKTKPWRIVYISDIIPINNVIYEDHPITVTWVANNFWFPTGLHLESRNSAIVSAHINDHSSIMIRLKGLDSIVKNVLYQDIKSNFIASSTFTGFWEKYMCAKINSLYNDIKFICCCDKS